MRAVYLSEFGMVALFHDDNSAHAAEYVAVPQGPEPIEQRLNTMLADGDYMVCGDWFVLLRSGDLENDYIDPPQVRPANVVPMRRMQHEAVARAELAWRRRTDSQR